MSNWTKQKIKDVRQAEIADISDGGLLLSREDLHAHSLVLPELNEELLARGIDETATFEDIDPGYFDFPVPVRRFPTSRQYMYRRGLFLVLKYALVVSWALMIPFGIMGEESAMLLVVLLPVLVWMFVLFALAWFTPGYRPRIGTCLRPFDDKKLSKPLKKFLRKHIGLRAHLYTLSDRSIKVNSAMRIGHILSPFVGIAAVLYGASLSAGAIFLAAVSPWVRQSIRVLKLGEPSAFLWLDKQIEKTGIRSAQSLLAGGTPFNVKCPNNGWKPCVQYLAYKSDFLVIDLSVFGPSVSWELELLKRKRMFSKCVMSRHKDSPLSPAFVAFLDADATEVFVYDDKGDLSDEDAERFRERLQEAVSNTRGRQYP